MARQGENLVEEYIRCGWTSVDRNII